jgi:hypothetical protein
LPLPGLERLDSLRQGTLEIERAHDPVFGDPERQVDHGDGHHPGLLLGAAAAALVAPAVGIVRIARIAAIRHRAHGGQKRRHGAHGGRFSGPAIAEYQYASDRGIDGGADQSELHLFLSNDRGEGINLT